MFSIHGGLSDPQIYKFRGNTCVDHLDSIFGPSHTYTDLFLCLALTWSIEIWSICPISLSASFVLSQPIYISLFALERLWRESLHVHCRLRCCTKALVFKKGYNNGGGCQMNHAFSGYSLHSFEFGLVPNFVSIRFPFFKPKASVANRCCWWWIFHWAISCAFCLQHNDTLTGGAEAILKATLRSNLLGPSAISEKIARIFKMRPPILNHATSSWLHRQRGPRTAAQTTHLQTEHQKTSLSYAQHFTHAWRAVNASHMAASTHLSALLRWFKKEKTFAASSLPVKERLWKYIEIYNIISGESAEIVIFTHCCHIETKLVSVTDVRKEKRLSLLSLK